MMIRVVDQGQAQDLPAPEGISLMDFLRRHGHVVSAPCGGRGTCGKCLVEVDGLGPVLACQTVIGRDLPDAGVVRLPPPAKTLILVDGLLRDQPLEPLVRRIETTVPPPSLDRQLADDERFLQASGYEVPFDRLAELPGHLAEGAGRVAFVGRVDTRSVLRFEADGILPGMAVDIGTTTLAAYLYDLRDGIRLASTAMANPQAAFGADVISRISRATDSPGDDAELRRAIGSAIARMAEDLLEMAAAGSGEPPLRPENLAVISLAGNTTMMHLLTGLPPAGIACAPFNPVSVRAQVLKAGDLGFDRFPDALAILLPSVSGYVGADITAGVIALGLERPGHETALLIDIGTNGEIVLRAGDRLTACSTAAGPAFEGASISAGMGGTTGAIDHVWLDGDDIRYTVIADPAEPAEPDESARLATGPIGICGSGLVDTVAVMLASYVIDETGRIGANADELPPPLRRRLTESGGQPAFVLAYASETGHGRPVLLTQKDIRELQNAKAAIAAGIQLLLRREGVEPAAVETIYLAGGFGQYLNVRSARTIGLLPEGLPGRVVAAGNTSAMGAIAALLNHRMIETAAATARGMRYHELSADPSFSDLFIDALLFPEQD